MKACVGPAARRLSTNLFIAVCVVMSLPYASADVTDNFTTLKSASTSTDLPLGQTGGATNSGLPGSLRPNLTYPTLRLDSVEPRVHQAASHNKPVENHQEEIVETDFQKLVKQTLGFSLPIFGSNLFDENTRGFEPIDQASIPSDFMLAPGDEIHINAWGTIDLDIRATIDRRGTIHIPKVGEVALGGVTFGNLEQHLRAAIARSYKGFELSVSLGQLRSIRVYVTGFAKSPGSYTVNSLSTVVNTLFYAGGPGNAGNLRQVELRRNGQLHSTLDLYDFILHGKTTDDVRVMPEDVIHIPAMAGEVAIAGAVNRPGIYQLGAINSLSELLKNAGNSTVVADKHRVVIERITAHGQRVVREVSLNGLGQHVELESGDLVLVNIISPEFKNAITLRGHVAVPLRHEWSEGMRISDLIPNSDALISPQYWITRNKQNQVAHFVTDRPSTRPEVNFPSINWEYAVVERINKDTLAKELHPFELGKAIHYHDPAHNLRLLPGDHVTVFSLSDFRTRVAQKTRHVQIEGEVLNAGYYEVGPNDTIDDLVHMAGGLTSDAYVYGTELLREGVRAKQAARIDDSIDQLERDYYRHLIERSRNVVSGEMTPAIVPEAAAIKGLIESLREAKPSGRVILELPENTRTMANVPKLTLADGDSIYIPPVPISVEVVGAVFRQGSFIYGDYHTGNYVSRAGLLPTADKRRIYVLRPDGTFTIAHKRVRIQPGDTIIVPEKVDRESAVRQLKDWTQVLYQFGLGAAGLRILDLF